MTTKRAERLYRGRQPSKRAEEMAIWAMDDVIANGLLTYDERVRRVQKHFCCGERAAMQAVKVAREMNRKRALDAGLKDEVLAKISAIADEATQRGDLRTALRALESVRDMLGLDAPDRVHHSGGIVSLDPERMSDEELAEQLDADREILVRAAKREAAAKGAGE